MKQGMEESYECMRAQLLKQFGSPDNFELVDMGRRRKL
jgi:hypothetical protein